jgi:four helix bundle protein
MGTQNKDFKDLKVWQAARQFRAEICEVARQLPQTEKFGLANQLRRAATSVTANIAGGFGRYGFQQNPQMWRPARGSVFKLKDHQTTCVDEQHLRAAEGARPDRIAQCVTQVLNGYLRPTLARKAGSAA